jgi:dihydroorotase
VAFSQADTPIIDTQVLYRALMYAHSFNFPVWLRPEDAYLARLGVAHDGAIATRLGLNGIPVMAEVIALHTLIELVKQTQTHVHVCRISSAEGIALIRAAKVAGLPITCDVGIHHVHLTDMDIGFFNPQARFAPPLRSQRDQAAIHYGLRDGTIDAICSDHTPHDEDEKLLPFAEADPGATGLELLLPLTLKWANEQQIDIAAALAKVTSQPAQLMRIAAGDLSVGAMADVCIFDPSHEWILTPQQLKSQGKNSPYLGYPLLGRVTHTLVAGELVFTLS